MLHRILRLTATIMVLAVATCIGMSTAAAADGGDKLITIIVNDPSNPYWKTEARVAKQTAQELGYHVNVGAHYGDLNKERQLIQTAILNHSAAIILDPANAEGSVGSVKQAVEAGIPVFIVNAEINQKGLAKAQLVSNNAQGAALAAQQFVQAVGGTAQYAELKGPASDNNAATRSNGFHTVLGQYPGMERVAVEVADWDRSKGYKKTQAILQAHPNITGIISGNDQMALGAIAALQQAGISDEVVVGGFDGSPAAVEAVLADQMAYTVLQPVAVFAQKAVQLADKYIRTGSTGLEREKMLFDCILITEENADEFVAPFILEGMLD